MNQCDNLSYNEIRANKFFKKCDLQTKNQTPGQQDWLSICSNCMLVWRQYSKNTHSHIEAKIGRHVTEDNFKCIFMNENVRISTKISSMFILKGPISNIPALVQIMAWRRPGAKPLSEPMMVRLSMHINQPQWVDTCIRWVFFMKHAQKYN